MLAELPDFLLPFRHRPFELPMSFLQSPQLLSSGTDRFSVARAVAASFLFGPRVQLPQLFPLDADVLVASRVTAGGVEDEGQRLAGRYALTLEVPRQRRIADVQVCGGLGLRRVGEDGSVFGRDGQVAADFLQRRSEFPPVRRDILVECLLSPGERTATAAARWHGDEPPRMWPNWPISCRQAATCSPLCRRSTACRLAVFDSSLAS
ncbi:hypothetical protein ID867_10525 [Streptomyces parvulus]|nr:hypothetical protein [Streptomyces parvulus]